MNIPSQNITSSAYIFSTGLLHPGAHLKIPGGRFLGVQPDDKLERRGGAQDGASKVEGEFGKIQLRKIQFGKIHKYIHGEFLNKMLS